MDFGSKQDQLKEKLLAVQILESVLLSRTELLELRKLIH